jgi:hypothetical protein
LPWMQQVIPPHKPVLESKASLLLIPPAAVHHCMSSCDFGSDGSSSETGSSGSESGPSPMNLDENVLLGAIIFSFHNNATHGSSLCRQKECSIMKPSWQMDQLPTPESQQGS